MFPAKIVSTIIVLVAIAVLGFNLFNGQTNLSEPTDVSAGSDSSLDVSTSQSDISASDSTVSSTTVASPFVLSEDNPPQTHPTQNQSTSLSEQNTGSSGLNESLVLSGFEVGTAPLNDDEFQSMSNRLRNDPALLQEVMDELRTETDETRAKRLKLLLADVANPELVPLAQEMLYSGSQQSELLALDLLRRIQDENPQARSIALDVLSSSSDDAVLVSAMNVFATPVPTDANEVQLIVNQMNALVDHDSPSVRRAGVSILARWGDSDSIAPVLVRGMSDVDADVRKSSAYALSKSGANSEDAKLALLSMAESADESVSGRLAAAQALTKMQLDLQSSERLEAAHIAIAKASRASRTKKQ